MFAGILVFLLGICLNFISIGYAAQSLLAALGSIQFVSNIAFAYVVLNKTVTVKVLVTTAFIVLGNVFLVAFGNHQSPVFTPEQLAEKYSNVTFLVYCGILIIIVAVNHFLYSTAGFWMTRLNEGLSLYDAILIVPMFQIAWTFFSICTGFIYFQEFQVFDALRTTMFILGMMCVFIGISLLAPDDTRGNETKDSTSSLDSIVSSSVSSEEDRLILQSFEDGHRVAVQGMYMKSADLIAKTKAACLTALGFGEDSINASAILVMPMVSSKITGFRGNGLERAKILSMRG
ncbi:putative magnesium transporter NIPA8 [Raphanus sativus]|nr:putative magnesium transporter NIPA8 [Raphanus sativus]